MTKMTAPGVNRRPVKRPLAWLTREVVTQPPQYTVSPVERSGQNLGPQRPPKAISRRLGRLGRAGGIAAKLQAAMAKAAGGPLGDNQEAQETRRVERMAENARRTMSRGGKMPIAAKILRKLYEGG